MFAFLPIIGPIINGIINAVTTIFTKQQDITIEKVKVGGQTRISDNQTDLGVIQARSAVAIAFQNDLGVKLCRDLIMFPIALWTACIAYVYTFESVIPAYTWTVHALPESIAYIPYAVIAFLFVTTWRK